MKTRSKEKIFQSSTELVTFLSDVRKGDFAVVFTNGCFDILHAGHVDYLEKSAQLGELLVVAINDDLSVKNLKGPGRPIIPLAQRMHMLASLECVDAVCSFSESTPLRMIQEIKPNVLVKGADYTIESIVGAQEVLDDGGRVETIEFVENISTSDIVDKIKGL